MDSLTELALSLQKPLLELVAQALMNELESRPISRKDAALLQGVSLPTYRRLRSNSPQIADDENYGEKKSPGCSLFSRHYFLFFLGEKKNTINTVTC